MATIAAEPVPIIAVYLNDDEGRAALVKAIERATAIGFSLRTLAIDNPWSERAEVALYARSMDEARAIALFLEA